MREVYLTSADVLMQIMTINVEAESEPTSCAPSDSRFRNVQSEILEETVREEAGEAGLELWKIQDMDEEEGMIWRETIDQFTVEHCMHGEARMGSAFAATNVKEACQRKTSGKPLTKPMAPKLTTPLHISRDEGSPGSSSSRAGRRSALTPRKEERSFTKKRSKRGGL